MSDLDLDAILAAQLAGMKVLYDFFFEVLPPATTATTRSALSEDWAKTVIVRFARHDPPILLGFPHEFKDE